MDLDFSNSPTATPSQGGTNTNGMAPSGGLTPPVVLPPITPTPISSSVPNTPAIDAPEPPNEVANIPVPPVETSVPPVASSPAMPENASPITPEPPVINTPSILPPMGQTVDEESPAKSGKLKWIILAVAILAIIGTAAYVFGTESGRRLIGMGREAANDSTLDTDLTNTSTDQTGLPSTVTGINSTGTDLATAPTSDTPLARDIQRKADLATIQTYLEGYKADKGVYPTAVAAVKTSDTSSVLVTSLVPTYVSLMPVDPKSSEGYYYGYKSADGITYELTSRLEDTTDPAGSLEGAYFIYRLRGDASSTVNSTSTTTSLPSTSSTQTDTTTL